MIKDYIKLAFVNLSHRRMRSWLTMIGIFIGIAAVVALIGLGEGLRTAITGQFGFLGTDILSVQASGIGFAGPPGAGVITPLDDGLAKKISKLGGVETAFNRRIESALLEFNDFQNIEFAGTAPGGENRKVFEKMVNLEPYQGRLLKDIDRRKVVLGHDYSEETNSYEKSIVAGDKITINGVSFEVVGILKKKGSFIFDSIILMNEGDMDDIFGKKGTADIIAVKVKDATKLESVKGDIEKFLRKERNVDIGEEDFQVESPQQSLEALDSTLFAVNLFVIIIASISLLVGGIGIMNTMYTSVLERTREIGILKAIGARNSVIFILFFTESGFLGLVGGIIGVALGLMLSYGTAFLGRFALESDLIQANVSLSLIIGALLFSFILGTVFGVLPAIGAMKKQPVEALRS